MNEHRAYHYDYEDWWVMGEREREVGETVDEDRAENRNLAVSF